MQKYTRAEMYQMFDSVVKPTDIDTAKYYIEFINDQLRYGAYTRRLRRTDERVRIHVISPINDWEELQVILNVYRLAGWYIFEKDKGENRSPRYDLYFSYTKEQYERPILKLGYA